jgi:hypothetical protein
MWQTSILCCIHQGHLFLELGDNGAARCCYEKALTRRAASDPWLIAWMLLSVGHAAWLQGTAKGVPAQRAGTHEVGGGRSRSRMRRRRCGCSSHSKIRPARSPRWRAWRGRRYRRDGRSVRLGWRGQWRRSAKPWGRLGRTGGATPDCGSGPASGSKKRCALRLSSRSLRPRGQRDGPCRWNRPSPSRWRRGAPKAGHPSQAGVGGRTPGPMADLPTGAVTFLHDLTHPEPVYRLAHPALPARVES